MQEPLTLGRYTLFRELAAGGMATVYLGRASGAVGFGRTVAIKRLHPHLARDPELVSRFVDEARLVARVHHPNVVPTLDVVAQDGEIFLVLEYVKGESLAGLLRTSVLGGTPVPVPVALSVIAGMLNGLHAAHEARDEKGEPLDIVHRDVSPHNVLVGADGIARVLDFGVAKAAGRLFGSTRGGQLKGKVPYMAPEQLGGSVTRQTDVYAAGVVLWETLTCRGLFRHENEMQLLQAILSEEVVPPSRWNPAVPPEVDRITMKALARNPAERYADAHRMAEDIDASGLGASNMKVGEWVLSVAGDTLRARSALVSELESGVASLKPAALQAALEARSVETELPTLATAPSVTFKLPRSSAVRPARSIVRRASLAGGIVLAASSLLVAFFVLRKPSELRPAATIAIDAGSASAIPMAAEVPDAAPPAAPTASAAPAKPASKPASKPPRERKPAPAVDAGASPPEKGSPDLARDRKG